VDVLLNSAALSFIFKRKSHVEELHELCRKLKVAFETFGSA
jgi:hypothetical protein